jgi:hypothetical protein
LRALFGHFALNFKKFAEHIAADSPANARASAQAQIIKLRRVR